MTITSPAFEDGGSIPVKYSCQGENISPSLSFGDLPSEADSFVLIIDDPDSPGQPWTHWLVWNIMPGQTEFSEGAVPPAIREGTNSGGKIGYDGPCPHNDQPHHYHFKIYALSNVLTSLDPTSSQKDLETSMSNCVIDQAELVGVFQRSSNLSSRPST